jgi:hypothetical protein
MVKINVKNKIGKRRNWRSTRLWTPVLLGLTLAFMEAGSLRLLWQLDEIGWFDIAIAVFLVIAWPLLMEAHARDAARLAHNEGWIEGFMAARPDGKPKP